MAEAAYWSGPDRREGAYDQRLWRDERRRHVVRSDAAMQPEASRGWGAVLSRVKARMRDDNLSIISAGVAFYALLAVFPGMAALVAIYGLVADPQQVERQVAIYGLVADPQQVERQVASLSAMLPPQAAEIITRQLKDLVQTDSAALGLGAAVGILLALWGASKGVRTLMTALNVAYHEEESRGTVKLYGTSLLLTLAAIVGFIVMIGLVVALPIAARFLGLGEALEAVIDFARWPVLALALVLGLVVMYRFGPSRDHAVWRWVTAGAVIATVLWIAGSALFSVYVTRFGNYNETYGAMGAVVILLMWFLLSAYAVLVGAVIDAERESPTKRNNTSAARTPAGRGN